MQESTGKWLREPGYARGSWQSNAARRRPAERAMAVGYVGRRVSLGKWAPYVVVSIYGKATPAPTPTRALRRATFSTPVLQREDDTPWPDVAVALVGTCPIGPPSPIGGRSRVVAAVAIGGGPRGSLGAWCPA